MAATQGTPSSNDILRLVMDRVMRGLAVAQVGRVESYDVDAQVADIKPMVLRMVPSGTEEGVLLEEERPVIPNVRVLHYRLGGFYIHAPAQAGDTVLLVVLDQDPSNWGRTGEVSRPADRRLHHLAHAVAIPGLFPSTAPLSGLGDNLQLGSEGGLTVVFTPSRMEVDGSSDAAALASKVDDLIGKYNGHVHPAGTLVDGEAPTPRPVTGATGATLDTVSGSSASSKLKLGG